jgi:pimeloyl-ACP methyl ester carboxylesterase
MTDVVLVHGAFHGAWCWDGVRAALDERGISSHAVELPLQGLAADATVARTAIEAAGPGVVVVAHSYGGVVVSEAATGVPGVRALVYLAAFMLEPDEDELSLLSAHGSELLSSLVPTDSGVAVDPAKAHRVFYGDSTPKAVAAIIPRLRPVGGDGSRSTREPAWKSFPSIYVVCTNDAALPVAAQRRMSARAGTVVEWPTDHSPFLTRPDAVADLLADALH